MVLSVTSSIKKLSSSIAKKEVLIDLKPLLGSSCVSMSTRKGIPNVLEIASMVRLLPCFLMTFREPATKGKYLGAFSKSVTISYMRLRGALITHVPDKTIGFIKSVYANRLTKNIRVLRLKLEQDTLSLTE